MLSYVVCLNLFSTNDFHYIPNSKRPPKVGAPESKRIKGLLKPKVSGAPTIGPLRYNINNKKLLFIYFVKLKMETVHETGLDENVCYPNLGAKLATYLATLNYIVSATKSIKK